jgi:hypothetical protein
MNRREAIRAVMAMPAVTRIGKAALEPKDVIVVECDCTLPLRAKEQITDSLARVWPGHHALICDGGLRLKVVRGAEVKALADKKADRPVDVEAAPLGDR